MVELGKQAVVVKAVAGKLITAGIIGLHGEKAFQAEIIRLRLKRPIRMVEADEIAVFVCFVDNMLNVIVIALIKRTGIL